jgi:hypothetical protein
MASDSSGLYLFGLIVLVILGVVAYSFISKRQADDKRKQQIKAFKASPVITKDAPALVHGPAAGPDLLLPTTGEHVAFYSMFVLSRESAITDLQKGIPISVQGLKMNKAKINSVKGFRLFETSGDFIVEQGETPYRVGVRTILEYFGKGAAMVSSFVGGQVKDAGVPEEYWNDAMNFQAAEPALKELCGFDAPIGTQNAKTRSSTSAGT